MLKLMELIIFTMIIFFIKKKHFMTQDFLLLLKDIRAIVKI